MLLAVVINSKSGGNLGSADLVPALRRGGNRVEQLDLAELDGELPAGADRLVVAGGDGSIGVAARAAHRAGIPLAVIPAGTANDFARALDLPMDLDGACRLAADPDAATRHHEVGMFGSHPFVNAAAAGLSAIASRYAGPLKPRLGAGAYALGAVRAGLSAPPLHCSVRCDGREYFAGDAWQVVVAVTGAFGGGSGIGGTRHDDGQLDVAVVPAGARIGLLRRAWGMRRAALTEQHDVAHHRGQRVELDLPAGSSLNVDGDLHKCADARFSLLPGGVEVVR